MLGAAKIIGFIPTLAPAQARRFYEDTLGLRFVSEDQFAVVLDAHGTMLRIAKVPDLKPHPFTVMGWEVQDIREVAGHLHDRGVRFEKFDWIQQDDFGIWTAPSGARVAWFKDPDGNLLSLTQFS